MRRAPISRYMIKKDSFRVFSLSVYSLGVCAELKKRPGTGTQVLTSLWECNYCKIKEFFLSQIFAEIQTFIYLLGYRHCPVGHKNPPQQLMGHPPLRSSQKNPITAVFGDQQDYSVSKEKQSGLICCPSLAGVTSCNEVPYFSLPPFFISSPTSPTVIWHFSPPAFPSRPGFFYIFFF